MIIGGAYHERCVRPPIERLRGSGLRAATVLRRVRSAPTLLTAVSADERDEFEAVSGGFGLVASAMERDAVVTFSYYTPVSPPAIDGVAARLRKPLVADSDTILQFGMIESGHDSASRCRTLILDPQGDTSVLPLESIAYDRLAIVGNEREIRRLGASQDVESAADRLRLQTNAECVVTKCGARGTIVTSADGVTRIGPRPTDTVQPIGSGDAFSAVFAHQYGVESRTSMEAADRASDFTASYVSSRSEIAYGEGETIAQIPFGPRPRVYLASPFFDLGQLWVVDLVRRALIELGADPFSPYHDVGVGGLEVAARDLAGLDASNSVLALLDAFDTGTVFEVGYAVRNGTPVVAYLDPRKTDQLTMIEGAGVEVTDDLATSIYRAIWAGMAP